MNSVILMVLVLLCTSCAVPYKPCTLGGQPPREGAIPFQGVKRCYQVPDGLGKTLNHGKYFEWFSNDKIAITGEYKRGKKVGRWIEYNEKGVKVSDKYFDEGKEIARP